MKLTRNEKQLLNNINTEPARIEDYCFWLKWEVNFGKGVLGSLTKKGLVESETQYNLQGWGHSGEVDAFIRNHPDTEKFVFIGLTFQGADIVDSLNE